jgi:predicted NAD/FAD-dependent oxidoreductase
MNAVCKHVSAPLNVRLQCEIASVRSNRGCWCLIGKGGKELGVFDIVMVSAPGPQSARLLEHVPNLAASAAQVRMQPCWAVMAAFDSPIPAAFDGAFVHDSALSWFARNSSKPGRSDARDTWVLHGSASWSSEQVEAAPEEVESHLLSEFWRVTGFQAVSPNYARAHRWRYALPIDTLGQPCLFDPVTRLGACGDWCWEPRVEGAFLSGLAAAESILRFVSLVP